MRSLIISPYFPPQNAVASLRVYSFARALVDAGAAVTVLTVAKRPDQIGLDLRCDDLELVELDYRVPRVFERLRSHYKSNGDEATTQAGPQAGAQASRGRRRPFDVVRQLRDSRGIFSSVRMPDLTDYWVKPAVRWCRGHGPWDIILSSSGPYTAHLAALAAKREGRGQRWIADFRDLWLDNHVYRGLFPFTLRERSLERQCLAGADLVTTVSTGLKRTLIRKGAPPVEVIFNGFDAAALARIPAARILPPDDHVRLVYTGALYAPGQDPGPLLEALARLRTTHPAVADRLRITVAGRGSAEWTELAAPLGVESMIEDRGSVSRDDALRMQRDAEALLIIDWTRPTEGILTGKLFEYVSASAPIIAIGGGSESPIAEAVTRSRRGHHLGVDPERIAKALVDLCERPESMRTEADRAFVDSFSRTNQAKRLVDCAERLLRPA
jgi:glycosyltransferase involved in cell wall biosynthesis